MEKFVANKVDKNEIKLTSSDDLEKVYALLEGNENFILQWNEQSKTQSKLMIATNIVGKVKNGEMLLSSTEDKK